MLNPKNISISVVILIAIVSRFIPHPPNFTPILSICFFSGIMFNKIKYAYSIPIIFMLLSDLIIGFYSLIFWVYFSLIIIISLGIYLNKNYQKSNNSKPIVLYLGTVSSSLIFYLISNFGVWIGSVFYKQDISGLINCYVAALPFLKNNLLSNLFFTTIIFYSYKIIFKKTGSLKIYNN